MQVFFYHSFFFFTKLVVAECPFFDFISGASDERDPVLPHQTGFSSGCCYSDEEPSRDAGRTQAIEARTGALGLVCTVLEVRPQGTCQCFAGSEGPFVHSHP